MPDIGQLTAQASRIATDIGTVAARVQSAFDSEAVMDLRRSIHDFGQVADRLVHVTNEQADVIGDVGSNLQQGSQALSRAAVDLRTTLGRVDTATNQGQLATILNNTAATSTDLRSASQDFRQLMAAANRNQESLVRVLQDAQPDEVYNLGAQSHVAVSFEEPEYTANSDALGALRLLEALRILGMDQKTQAWNPHPATSWFA